MYNDFLCSVSDTCTRAESQNMDMYKLTWAHHYAVKQIIL